MVSDEKKVLSTVSYDCWNELDYIRKKKRVTLSDVVKDILEKYTSKKSTKLVEDTN